MPRGPKPDFFGTIRAQAAKVLQQLERQIHALEDELSQLREQFETWRALAGGGRVAAGRRPGRHARRPAGTRRSRSGGKRVKWDEVLAFVPKRFGVQDVMKHPGAAAKGRAQVYPALNRWESTKRIRRVGKGVYEKTGGDAAPAPVKRATAKRSAGRKRTAKRAKPAAAKAPESKAS
jgi:hypothetical protein